MIIGCCGFSASGSSAVTDYLKEFSSIYTMDEKVEFVLSYYPDGLEDLEYHLMKNCSKYSSSAVAIERFRRHMYYYFIPQKSILGKTSNSRNELIKITEKFINSITQTSWTGMGGSDYPLYFSHFYKTKVPMYIYLLGRKLNKVFRKKHYPLHRIEFSIQPKDFNKHARTLVKDILTCWGCDINKTIVLDQPFAGNDPQKSFKYFDNPVAIVVDRDPRDLYLFSKIFLKGKGAGYQIPTDNVYSFITYYKQMRINQPYRIPDDRVLVIQFEDMIYRYEETTDRIVAFCGLDKKDRNNQYFIPEMSKNNTLLFKRFSEFQKDVDIIERELSDYLYDFNSVCDDVPNGQMFFGKSPLNR